ncbi:MAG TPA: efflux RND transporter periplasmic adaptor subunit [Gammaproteobacteria bacterium]|nr:efflux RND transporter periplasmic adaptor subunit [Gammaproteobacteria bacterium]
MKKRSIIIVIILALVAGIFIGRYSERSSVPEKKPMYWVDTMEPTIHYPGPGKSRMGMELVPVYPEGQEGDQSGVRISPVVINNLGVRTTSVIQGTLARRIEAVGYVEPNENKISHIHSYSDGWVRKMFVNTVGAPVKKDQVLLQLYSPMLINAQEEYLIALDSRDKDLTDASIKKLQALHISPQQIQQLINTKKSSQLVDIVSPQDGVLTELNVREGMKITPETEMMSLVDLSSIWMIAQVFEDQSVWVKVGELAEARLSAFPNKIWKGEVEYVYPQVDPTTRTLKVRFRFNNPDEILKPNMYANISLFTKPKENILSIPLEALIRSSQGDRVIVSLGNGHFQVRPVTTGIESGDQVEILSGLHADERVVASGQFLIDSEANLKAGLERVETPSQPANQSTKATWSNIIIEGKGIIKALNVSGNALTLQHEPIPVLSWPEMTMDFSVEKEINLSQFQLGDHVKFTLRKDKDNKYVITDMKKLTP